MGKRRVEVKRIQNPTSRHVTFSKRRNGLLKKACELSVLCDVEVALIVFSPTGKIYEFASHSIDETIEKYRTFNEICNDPMDRNCIQSIENRKMTCLEVESLQKEIDNLQETQKHMIGENLGSLSLEELDKLERKLKVGIDNIYSRKMQILSNNCEILVHKVHSLQEENGFLKNMSSNEGHNSVVSPRILSINVMDRLQFQPDCNVHDLQSSATFTRQNTSSEASRHPESLQLGFKPVEDASDNYQV
eukprot:Gb_19178 [translate_table: standard]